MESEDLVQKVQATFSLALDMPCWYVTAGRGTGSAFSLDLGRKLRRRHPLRNRHLSEESRRYGGESSLMVWCTWRLDGRSEALASSDEEDVVIERKLELLVGRTLEAVEVTSPAWDLQMSFSGDLQLRIFSDHVPGDPSFDGNWQFRVRRHTISAGPGFRLETGTMSETEWQGYFAEAVS